jgi:hypothetical protein
MAPLGSNISVGLTGYLMPRNVSEKQFLSALQALGKPGGRQLKFLQEHFHATGRAATATQLANAAKYKKWHTLNLHYCTLGKRIAKQLGHPSEHLGLLVDFSGPGSLTNEHWVLFMKPEFAAALAKADWVK